MLKRHVVGKDLHAELKLHMSMLKTVGFRDLFRDLAQGSGHSKTQRGHDSHGDTHRESPHRPKPLHSHVSHCSPTAVQRCTLYTISFAVSTFSQTESVIFICCHRV